MDRIICRDDMALAANQRIDELDSDSTNGIPQHDVRADWAIDIPKGAEKPRICT
jgi:hypothetical protein